MIRCAVILMVLVAEIAAARPLPPSPRPDRGEPPLVGGVPGLAKAAGDSFLVMGPWGSGAPYVGNFETGPWADPAWNGWTGVDLSVGANPWHVDTYNAVSGAYSAWCGEIRFPSCGPGDPDGGYGNNYNAVLEWTGTVADPGLPCTVTVAALVNHDVEPGYDSCALVLETAGGEIGLWSADGTASALAIGGSHVFQPGDYLAGGRVVVLFRVTSDSAWSDEDCAWPTAGAMQLDDVVVTLSNGQGMSHDFEDGSLGPMVARPAVGVGNFARIWQNLEDLDPCVSNYTPQVAFIDDGIVVPGTGGSVCVNWCYGPNGYIVNTTGGLAGPEHHLHNAVRSPVMAWPDQAMNGASLAYTALLHEDLSPDAPGMFHFWQVRSTASGDPADLEAAPWRSNQTYFYDWGGEYHRETWDLTALLEPGRTHVQVQVGVQEAGWLWGYVGDDGYPAPYYDNVRLLAWEMGGPAISALHRHLAQDAFPEHGIIDQVAHGTNHVRFDMATNISPDSPLHNVPGDSLVFVAAPARSGAVLAAAPRLRYRLQRNPVFDAWRTAGLPDRGSVAADSVFGSQGAIANRWCVDLPDSGFLFPGDVLRYYLEASDDVGGDVRTAILPADTTGFSAADDPWAYDPRFTMRALPGLKVGIGGLLRAGPTTLVWFDSGQESLDSLWRPALAANNLEPGRDIDIFRTVSPGSGLGNGLGGRATLAHLAGYTDLVYSAGDASWNSLAQPDDPYGDLQRLDTWLSLGDRDAFMAGDNLASSLSGTGFLAERMGLGVVAANLRPLIDNQVAPQVVAADGGPLELTGSWIAYGGCLVINDFDAVQPLANAQSLAQFTDPGGQPDRYTYAAATLATDAASGSRVVSVPYDLGFVYNDPEVIYRPGGTTARSSLLRDVGIHLGFIGPVSAVPDAGNAVAFGTRHWPNPFNPKVTIECA
ncbi:MAG: hypothetical protein R6X35_07055, partial [Candidatus Krumholzibacteriia bacterium]